MTEAGEMSLGLESLKAFGGKLVQAAFGFVGAIVFARLLGPASYGGFYFLLALVFIADRPFQGLSQAVKKRFSETNAPKPEIVGGVLVVNTVVVSVVGIGVLVFADRLVRLTTVESAGLVFMAILVARGFFAPFQKMMAGEGWIAKEVWNDTLRSVLTFLLQLGFVLAGFGAAGMGYGLAGATLLVIPVALYVLRVRPSLPSRRTLRSLWDFAKYSTPAAFVGKAYDRFDVILLGAILTTGAAGLYEVAYKLTVPAVFVSGVVTAGLMSKVSNLHSKNLDATTDVTNSISYVSILAIPIFFGALAIPKAIVVTAYGPAYSAAATLLVGLAFYQVVHTQTEAVQQTLLGLEFPDVVLKIDVAALVFNIVAGIGLIYLYGAIGVVVATVVAESIRYTLSAYTLRQRIGGVDFLPRTLAEQFVAGVLMFAFVELLGRFVAVRSWIDLGALVGSGAVVYGVVLLLLSEQLRFTLRAIWTDAVSG